MSTPTPAPYDVNFCFLVRDLESDRVKLTPFIVSLASPPIGEIRDLTYRSVHDRQPTQHADLFFQGSASHPELYQHMSFGPYSSASAFTENLVRGHIQPNPSLALYAVLDKTQSQPISTGSEASVSPSSANFAGMIGYIRGSATNLSVEIGLLVILPPFQRTHVTTNAVGLLLRYALDLPTASPPGLGLRRVQWQASERNDTSIRAAQRLGFRREGLLMWDSMFPGDQGKVGNGEDIREGDPRPGTLGRHTLVFAICWDDWENGGREQVTRLMDK